MKEGQPAERWVCWAQGREGKVVQVYRKKWVIHIERITREKVNGEPQGPAAGQAGCRRRGRHAR